MWLVQPESMMCVVWCAGNGSQWPRMGRELLQSSATFRNSIDICAKALSPYGIDLLAAYEAEEGFGNARTAAVGLASIQVGPLVEQILSSTLIHTVVCPGAVFAYDQGLHVFEMMEDWIDKFSSSFWLSLGYLGCSA